MDIYAKRLANVKKLMFEENIDYLVLAPTTNMFYLTGLKTVADERLQVAVLPAEGPITLILPEMYGETAKEIRVCHQLLTWADNQNPVDLVRAAVAGREGRVAVDDRMWAGHLLQIMQAFSGFQFVAAQKIMGRARVGKDQIELSLLKLSGELADAVMKEVMQEIKVGITEKQLAAFIANRIKVLGGDDISFQPIVASGPNGALPHHHPGDRKFEQGDFIVVDFGALLQGYCSDITRTFCLGKASEESKKIYLAVQEANEAGFQAVSNGVACQNVDKAARDAIKRAGYGNYFIHRTGHGIGLDYHEEPYLVAGNLTPLRPGMVFSVEPGIYLAGRMGVRIEDIVALTEDGPRRFNNFPRELIEL